MIDIVLKIALRGFSLSFFMTGGFCSIHPVCNCVRPFCGCRVGTKKVIKKIISEEGESFKLGGIVIDHVCTTEYVANEGYMQLQ